MKATSSVSVRRSDDRPAIASKWCGHSVRGAAGGRRTRRWAVASPRPPAHDSPRRRARARAAALALMPTASLDVCRRTAWHRRCTNAGIRSIWAHRGRTSPREDLHPDHGGRATSPTRSRCSTLRPEGSANPCRLGRLPARRAAGRSCQAKAAHPAGCVSSVEMGLFTKAVFTDGEWRDRADAGAWLSIEIHDRRQTGWTHAGVCGDGRRDGSARRRHQRGDCWIGELEQRASLLLVRERPHGGCLSQRVHAKPRCSSSSSSVGSRPSRRRSSFSACSRSWAIRLRNGSAHVRSANPTTVLKAM